MHRQLTLGILAEKEVSKADSPVLPPKSTPRDETQPGPGSKELRRLKQREAERRYKLRHREEILARNKTPEARARQAAYVRAWRKGWSFEQHEARRRYNNEYVRTHRDLKNRINEKSRIKRWEKVKATQRLYRQKNGEKIRAYFRNYLPRWKARHRLENPQFMLKDRLRSAIKRGLKAQGLTKLVTTEKSVGCSVAEFQRHFESLFTNGQSLETPGLSIDHIVPICAFNLVDPEERRWAFNWRNTRPLDIIENKRKQATIPSPLPSWLPPHIAERIESRRKGKKNPADPSPVGGNCLNCRMTQ